MSQHVACQNAGNRFWMSRRACVGHKMPSGPDQPLPLFAIIFVLLLGKQLWTVFTQTSLSFGTCHLNFFYSEHSSEVLLKRGSSCSLANPFTWVKSAGWAETRGSAQAFDTVRTRLSRIWFLPRGILRLRTFRTNPAISRSFGGWASTHLLCPPVWNVVIKNTQTIVTSTLTAYLACTQP